LTPIAEQVDSLAKLEPGWFDGDGSAYDPVQLAWLAERLGAVVSGHGLSVPHIYPTPDGYVLAEWSAERWEVSATFNLTSHEAQVFVASLESEDFVERCVLLDEPGAEDELGLFLREHVGV
jgi:hypothetical protein